MSKNLKGSLLVIIAGCAWGISGVSGQYLMSHGVHINLLTSLRLLISGLILLTILVIKQPNQLQKALTNRSLLLGTFLFSLFGLVLNQFAYLQAIQHTNAGTATVLQYVTPILILVLVCLKNRTAPTMVELLSIILAVLGTFIIATHGQLGNLAITPVGLFWGLFSAVTYAAYIIIPVKLIHEWGSILVIGLGMLIGGIVFPIFTQAWRYDIALGIGNNLLAYVGMIGVGTVFAYTAFLKGTSIVGPVKGSLLAAVEPIASVLLTVLLMKEVFYVIDILGMIFIFAAVLLISLKDLLAVNKNSQL